MAYKKNRNKQSYEGGQYRGGREKGKKNLKKIEGGVVNQYGIAFTLEEKKALETAVNTANRKRARMLKSEGELSRMGIKDGKAYDTGDKVATLHVMGKESDFILAQKTKSLQRFKSKEEYENYMENLHRVNQRDYVDMRIELYKANHAQAILNELHDAKLADAVLKMDKKEYAKLVQSYEDVMEIHYIYGPDKRDEKIAEIKAAMQLDDDYKPIIEEPKPKRKRRKKKKKK